MRNIFKNEMLKMQQMRKHPVYKKVMSRVDDLRDEGFDRDEAIRCAISHRKYLLYRMIPSDVELSASDMDISDDEHS